MPLASPDDIVAALKDYGCRVHEWPGWRTRGRPYRFDPYGQAWHHDAFSESYPDLDAARYIAELGRSDLPAPLANGAIGNYSTIYLLAYGNANHAGWNIASVHQRLRAGRAPIGDARHITESDTVVGNPGLWGWECRNAGTGHDPWDQLEAMERAGAAMSDCCGWSPMASAAHRELTRRKIDPAGFDMHAFRADIARITTTHHAPDPLPSEDQDMSGYFLIESTGGIHLLHPCGKLVGIKKIETAKAWTAAGVPTVDFGDDDVTKAWFYEAFDVVHGK